jgi:outer membrane lipoprotein-sorting protein
MRRALITGVLSLLTVLCSQVAAADFVDVEFSADMVQTGSRGASAKGKMYVSKDGIRTEFEQDGKTMVRIIDNVEHVVYILFPEQKTYMEQRGPAGGPTPATGSTDKSPCAGMPGLTCTKQGTETVGGRSADKWEVVSTYQGKTMKSVQWLDSERGIPLRQEWSGGQKMELKLLGTETRNGRSVEKWELVTTQPGGQTTRSLQWYDPRLQLAIREELPGGLARELINIQEGPQPNSLFQVPSGYTKMEMPTPQSQQGASPSHRK